MSLALNGRIPIFAVSASLAESQREEMIDFGMDGWILKPIDYKRMNVLIRGITDLQQRKADLYETGCEWEAGGWLICTQTPGSELSSSMASSDGRAASSSLTPGVTTDGVATGSPSKEDGTGPPSDYEPPSPPERADTPDDFPLPRISAEG